MTKFTYNVVPRWYPRNDKDVLTYWTEPRIYISVKGEKQLTNLTARYERPWEKWAEEIVPKILQNVGLPADTTVRWDQNAGSGAGADPGFIIEVRGHKFDVWVEVEPDNPPPNEFQIGVLNAAVEVFKGEYDKAIDWVLEGKTKLGGFSPYNIAVNKRGMNVALGMLRHINQDKENGTKATN